MTDPDLSNEIDDDAKARILEIAGMLEVPPPPTAYQDGHMVLTDELRAWFRDNGVSIDWALCGSMENMARAYQREFARLRLPCNQLKGHDRERK